MCAIFGIALAGRRRLLRRRRPLGRRARCRSLSALFASLVSGRVAGVLAAAGAAGLFAAAVVLVDGRPCPALGFLLRDAAVSHSLPRCGRLCVPACRCIWTCRHVASRPPALMVSQTMRFKLGSSRCRPGWRNPVGALIGNSGEDCQDEVVFKIERSAQCPKIRSVFGTTRRQRLRPASTPRSFPTARWVLSNVRPATILPASRATS